MDGVASCTEDSVDDCSFSTGGFSIDEPSNRPLKLNGKAFDGLGTRCGVRKLKGGARLAKARSASRILV